MTISVQTTLHISNKGLLRITDDILWHAADVAQVRTHRFMALIVIGRTRPSLRRVDIWAGARLGDFNELLIVGQLVLRIDPTTPVCT